MIAAPPRLNVLLIITLYAMPFVSYTRWLIWSSARNHTIAVSVQYIGLVGCSALGAAAPLVHTKVSCTWRWLASLLISVAWVPILFVYTFVFLAVFMG